MEVRINEKAKEIQHSVIFMASLVTLRYIFYCKKCYDMVVSTINCNGIW